MPRLPGDGASNATVIVGMSDVVGLVRLPMCAPSRRSRQAPGYNGLRGPGKSVTPKRKAARPLKRHRLTATVDDKLSSLGIALARSPSSHRTRGMDYSDQRNVRLDERDTDRVSQWLLRVAISMIVLGTVFNLLG